jgi:hypothetical protein
MGLYFLGPLDAFPPNSSRIPICKHLESDAGQQAKNYHEKGIENGASYEGLDARTTARRPDLGALDSGGLELCVGVRFVCLPSGRAR